MTGPKHPVGMLEAFQLFRYPIMWVCAGIQFVRFGVTTSFTFWLPSLLVSDRGLSLQAAGLITALGFALTGVGNALGGYTSDRLRNPPLVIGGSLAVLACTSALLGVVDSIPLLVLVVAVNSIFVQFYFGPLFHVPVEVLGSRVAGMSAGFGNMFANLGALSFAYSLGVVKDRAGGVHVGFSRDERVLRRSASCSPCVLARIRAKALASSLSEARLSQRRLLADFETALESLPRTPAKAAAVLPGPCQFCSATRPSLKISVRSQRTGSPPAAPNITPVPTPTPPPLPTPMPIDGDARALRARALGHPGIDVAAVAELRASRPACPSARTTSS